MRKGFLRMSSICAALTAAVAGMGTAQVMSTVSVTFPFAVTVGSKVLPQGEYKVSSYENGNSPIFIVRGANGDSVALAAERISRPLHTAAHDGVVFSSVGDTHKMLRLWVGGETDGYQFYGSK